MASNGTYGTRIPVSISEDDIDIYYSYRPTRNTDDGSNTVFHKLSSNILTQSHIENEEGKTDTILEGMYNLKLPVEYFNKKGFYTVYIKPKEIEVNIADVSTLSAYPDINGIVINTENLDNSLKSKFLVNNSLVGYRVIYFNGNSRQDYYRVVTSNNKCEPVIQSVNGNNSKLTHYRYNESSNLVFITVTPSSAPSFKANAAPFIGTTAQRVAFVNTKFEPIMLELEMVDHDADTISTMLEGNQLRDLDNGIVTTFNENDEIYAQHEHYSLKDDYTGKPVYEVKRNKKDNIDFSQSIEDK